MAHKSFYLLACILLFFLSWSCQKEKSIDYAIVSGNISNAENSELTLESMNRAISKKIIVEKNGTFRDTLELQKNAYYFLHDGNNRIKIYLQPQYNLGVNYNYSDFQNTVEITGKGSEASRYVLAKQEKEKVVFKDYQGKGNSFYKLDEKEFKALLKDYKATFKEMLANTDGLSTAFIETETKDLDYFYLLLLSDYEMAHGYETDNRDFKVSEGFLTELQNVDYANGDDYDISGYYRSLARRHYDVLASEQADRDSLNRDSLHFDLLKKIPDTLIKNSLLYNRAEFGITYAKDLESYYDDYMAASTNRQQKDRITEIYQRLKKLRPGMPSPEFEGYENHSGGTTSLTDLSGKYVYVDVWATWCGPCIAEIPDLQKIEETYHDKNLEFVSISIDRPADKEKWKKMVVEKELKGVQLFADKEWSSSFVKEYQIMGIPRFLLIGPEGKIVDSNAPRPSDPRLVKVLDSLLL